MSHKPLYNYGVAKIAGLVEKNRCYDVRDMHYIVVSTFMRTNLDWCWYGKIGRLAKYVEICRNLPTVGLVKLLCCRVKDKKVLLTNWSVVIRALLNGAVVVRFESSCRIIADSVGFSFDTGF